LSEREARRNVIRVRVGGLILMLVSGVACGGASSPAISAKDFDRVCAGVVDCFPVYEGVLSCCTDQRCPNAAIRQDNVAMYTTEVDARTPMCTGPLTPGNCLPPSCAAGRAACVNGLCALEVPSADGATGQ